MNEPVKQGTESYELYEGDQITVGMTHEIKVGYDKSWVKYEAVTKVRPGETAAGARTRAIGHVNESSMRAVAQTVETVRRFTA
jgi:hypothetical protein